jgi:hypothetical protein
MKKINTFEELCRALIEDKKVYTVEGPSRFVGNNPKYVLINFDKYNSLMSIFQRQEHFYYFLED